MHAMRSHLVGSSLLICPAQFGCLLAATLVITRRDA